MGRESSDVVARADGGGRRAMRLMVVTIAISDATSRPAITTRSTLVRARKSGFSRVKA